jgi:2-phosphosulfolactate phosphatase
LNLSTDKSTQPVVGNLAELLKVWPKRIDVALLPSIIEPLQMQGRTVVVTDVLRATTTAIQALVNGCREVLPQPSIEAAKNCHARISNSILGGERGGRIIPGFHQGNSPLEYERSQIDGKSLILATTNGTVAMERCRMAHRVLIGAMTNLGAVADKIAANEQVTIVCSGTDGEITSEDTVFAGALVERILQKQNTMAENRTLRGARLNPLPYLDQISDMALIALNHWQRTCDQIERGTSLADLFKLSRGGVNLVKIGLDADIEFAARIDEISIVPELNISDWAIRVKN